MVFLKKKVFVVDTNFVVFITKKETNKNTAFLAILNSQASDDETIKDLPHINLFDEKEIKEVISDPVGSKYPMAVFTFDDNGKILEIKLPNNMDEYHAETISELIEKVNYQEIKMKI